MSDPFLSVRLLREDETLPRADSAVFQDPCTGNILYSRAWLETFQRNGIAPGDRLRFYALERQSDHAPLALMPAVYSRLYSVHPRARVLHFLQPEALESLPLLAEHGHTPVSALERVLEFLRAGKPPYEVLRFSPMRPGTPLSLGLMSVLRRTGHALQIYSLPREYHGTTAGLSAADYLAGRPRTLREAIEHIEGALAGRQLTFQLVQNVQDIEEAWRNYQKILDANESDPEPESPRYLPDAMRVAAESGSLRLGFIHLDGEPAAVQLWIVSASIGQCLRIESILRHEALRLDDLLTQGLAKHLIDVDHIAELNFGALNAPFIRGWAPHARKQIGLAAFNLRTWRGLKGAIRHVSAGKIRSLLAGQGRGA